MREARSKLFTMTIKNHETGEVVSLGLFRAEKWSLVHGPKGLLRVMVGEKWRSRHGEKYDWHSCGGIGHFITGILKTMMGIDAQEQGEDMPDGARVIAETPTGVIRTYTKGSTFEHDGQRFQMVVGYKYPLPCEAVRPLAVEGTSIEGGKVASAVPDHPAA